MGRRKERERVIRLAMEAYTNVDPIGPFVQEATYHCLRELFPDITTEQWEWFFRKYGDEIAPRVMLPVSAIRYHMAEVVRQFRHYRYIYMKPPEYPSRQIGMFLSSSRVFDFRHHKWALNGYKHGRRPRFWIKE